LFLGSTQNEAFRTKSSRPDTLERTLPAIDYVLADLLTIKEVGGWKTLAMVERYAHLTPNRLHEAVERLVSKRAPELARN